MRYASLLTLALVLASATRADDPTSPTPAEQFKAILAAQRRANADFNVALNAAKSEAERKQALETLGRKGSADSFADDVLAIVKKYPKDTVALDAFLWLHARLPSREQTAAAAEVVGREWVRDERMGRVCVALAYPPSDPAETLLRAAIDKTPYRAVRGQALFSLAKALFDRMNGLRNADSPERAALEQEVGRLLTEVTTHYGDLKRLKTLDREADAMLFEMLHLSVGKVPPDITGDDMAGKPMKLSDSRGKVTLLDFGASWCGPCMSDAPHVLALLKKYGDKGFAVVGVNCDGDLVKGNAAYAKAGITWRSFADGDDGPIVRRWNVPKWPTLYLLDGKGVIRYKGDSLRGISARREADGKVVQFHTLDDAVEALMKEAAAARGQ